MEYQIVIYSADAVFARMLELEFSMRELSVLTLPRPQTDLCSEVALLDLDSSPAPTPASYRRMIGFTRGAALSEDETRRQCSMILRRPFEMRLLRREVLSEILTPRDFFEEGSPQMIKPVLDIERKILSLEGKEIALTPTETTVMQALLAERGNAVSRETLAALIGASAANKTDVYVCYLRRKIETVTGQRIIRTLRGRGYCVVI